MWIGEHNVAFPSKIGFDSINFEYVTEKRIIDNIFLRFGSEKCYLREKKQVRSGKRKRKMPMMTQDTILDLHHESHGAKIKRSSS